MLPATVRAVTIPRIQTASEHSIVFETQTNSLQVNLTRSQQRTFTCSSSGVASYINFSFNNSGYNSTVQVVVRRSLLL